MAWKSRSTGRPMVKIGDAPDERPAVEGTLTGIRASVEYPDNKLFDITSRDGEEITVAGTAVLNNALTESDKGRAVRLTFKGWGKAKNGSKFRNIAVDVDEDATPRPATPRPAGEEAPPPAEPPVEDEGDGDDLPF